MLAKSRRPANKLVIPAKAGIQCLWASKGEGRESESKMDPSVRWGDDGFRSLSSS